jgi:hypothetical protein
MHIQRQLNAACNSSLVEHAFPRITSNFEGSRNAAADKDYP